MSKYDAIIFDCDGTLVDTEYVLNNVCSVALKEMGYHKYTTEYCMEKFIGMSLKPMLDSLLQELGPDFDKEAFVKRIVEFSDSSVLDGVQHMPHADEMLESLGDFPRCVASNGNRRTVVHSLKATGLYPYFTDDTIFTHELVARPKPAADLFLYAADTMKANPKRCLVVEDSLIGTAAARAAGMDVLVYKHLNAKLLEGLEQLNPTAVISDLREVTKHALGNAIEK